MPSGLLELRAEPLTGCRLEATLGFLPCDPFHRETHNMAICSSSKPAKDRISLQNMYWNHIECDHTCIMYAMLPLSCLSVRTTTKVPYTLKCKLISRGGALRGHLRSGPTKINIAIPEIWKTLF